MPHRVFFPMDLPVSETVVPVHVVLFSCLLSLRNTEKEGIMGLVKGSSTHLRHQINPGRTSCKSSVTD